MGRIFLFEKFIAPFDSSAKKAAERMKGLGIKKIPGEDRSSIIADSEREIHDAAFAIRDWFYGKFMHIRSNDDDVWDAIKLFKKVGASYHTEVKGPMYRVAHIRVGPNKAEEDILDIKKCQPGPKKLQSWSTTQKGAEWFFKHFVKEQNEDDVPAPGKSWVLLKSSAENFEQLLTFEECMQFFYDIASILKIHPTELLADDLQKGGEMIKMHELICVVPEEIPVEIVEVFVLPKK